MSERPQLLIDCDPGIDDAFAIFCAIKYADVAAITTVSGNVAIEHTTRNARYLVELASADISVHRGAAAPLRVAPVHADAIHGATGFGATPTPEPRHPEHEVGAVEAILDHCSRGDAVIVAMGPLTNIALALNRDPSLASRIRALHWMGGGTEGGNVTEFAEFNAWVDPDAVDVVLQSGTPITMYGLNLTHQVRMTPTEISRLRAAKTSNASIFADVLSYYGEHRPQDDRGQPMHDPCAVLGVTHPALFEVRDSHIVCDVHSIDRRGMTTASPPKPDAPHRLAVRAMADEVIEHILDAVIDVGQ